MHQPERAQRLDQLQLAQVEGPERLVALEDLRDLRDALLALAGQHHPEVLHRRPVAGVVEVHEVRTIVAPEHVAHVAVAMDADGAEGV